MPMKEHSYMRDISIMKKLVEMEHRTSRMETSFRKGNSVSKDCYLGSNITQMAILNMKENSGSKSRPQKCVNRNQVR